MDLITYDRGHSRLVLSMPHSAVGIPEGLDHHLDLRKGSVRRTIKAGTDYCVPFVTGMRDYKSAARIICWVPRAVFDVNRLSADMLAVDGGSDELDAHGMIWRATMDDPPSDMLTHPYSREEFDELLRRIYDPFIKSTRHAMDHAVIKHGMAIRVDLHSMPANRMTQISDGKYKDAYRFGEMVERGPISEGKYPDLLLVGDHLCSRDISDRVIEIFSSQGLMIERLKVREDMASAAEHVADPGKSRHSFGIEIVGHDFEPGRRQGLLVYDDSKEKRFRRAFKKVFKTSVYLPIISLPSSTVERSAVDIVRLAQKSRDERRSAETERLLVQIRRQGLFFTEAYRTQKV